MMKRSLSITAAALLLLALAPERVQPSDEVRGVALGLFASDPNYDYGALVEEIDDRGATDLLVTVQWQMANAWADEVRKGSRTAPSAVIRRTISQARDRGLRVTVMPIVRLDERTPQQWRGNIKPDPQRWFRAYRRHLLELAELADDAGAVRLVVGSELGSMQRRDGDWRELIGQVRTRFDGQLTYSANWDDFDSVGFWDALDEVAVTGYFPLDPADLEGSWARPRASLETLRRTTGKPVLVTEVGYPSHRRAAERPWDQLADDVAAPILQAQLYRAFCDAAVPAVDGYFFWNWFGYGGPREVSFTPRGKPAAAELERCLRQ